MTSRRDLSKAYKERTQHGGVYTITNSVNGKYLLGVTPDLASMRNRFQFAVSTGSAVDMRLRADWQQFGGKAFSLDVLEELDQKPDQTEARFLDDLRALEQLLRAQLDPDKSY
jgi:hypothetical protein